LDTTVVETMAYKDPVAAAAQKYKPIQSAVPGTTLGPIQIEAFLGGGVCFYFFGNLINISTLHANLCTIIIDVNM
jgi:hypothetical protein